MNKLSLSSLQNIFSLVDYLTLYQIKYTNKYFYNTINELGLSHVLDLRNVKYEKENNVIYKILQKHQHFFTKIILEFRTINDTHVFKFSDKLTHINLNYCQKITDQSLFHISKTCKKLTHLELYILPNITDKGLKEVIMNCCEISHLNLSGCRHFTNESLMLIPKYLTKLTFLDLTRCLGVTDEFLIELVKYSQHLKHLNLYALPDLKCTFLAHLSNDKLEFLDLCGNQCVNDELFKKADGKLRNIKSINLSWCSKLTDDSIKSMFENNDSSQLELISLHGILGITDRAIDIMSNNKGIKEHLNTIDLCACSNTKNRTNEYLKGLFPHLVKYQYFF